jgi:hypothetical protein
VPRAFFSIIAQCVAADLRGNEIALVNSAGERIASGTLVVGRKSYEFAKIAPAKAITIPISSTSGADYRVTVMFATGRSLTSRQMGYLAGCLSVRDTVEIQPGRVLFKSEKILGS